MISIDGVEVFRDSISSLRQKWEKTSFELEKLQTNSECVEQEEEEMRGDKEEMKMGEIKEEEVKEMEREVRTKEEDEKDGAAPALVAEPPVRGRRPFHWDPNWNQRQQQQNSTEPEEQEQDEVQPQPDNETAPDNALVSSSSSSRPRVAILREEGSNGDREMAAAFKMAGFRVFDVTMTDIISGRVTLDR